MLPPIVIRLLRLMPEYCQSRLLLNCNQTFDLNQLATDGRAGAMSVLTIKSVGVRPRRFRR